MLNSDYGLQNILFYFRKLPIRSIRPPFAFAPSPLPPIEQRFRVMPFSYTR